MADPFPIISKTILACSLAITVLGGCASDPLSINSARHAFANGDLTLATQTLEQLASSGGRDQRPAELDLAIVDLASGKPRQAQQRLRKLRDDFDQMPKFSVIGEAASMLTDDNARPFRPATYEEVMIRSLLAITSLADDEADAESFINQAAMRQAELRREHDQRQEKLLGKVISPAPNQELALAPYLRGVLREATHHDLDDAARNYRLVSSIRPDFAPAMDDLQRATGGVHSSHGHGALYVIALVGRGPVLQPVEAPVTSAAVSIASTLMLKDEDKKDDVDRLPKISRVEIPSVVIPPSPISAVTVSVTSMSTPSPKISLATQINSAHQINSARPLDVARLLGATQTITNVAEMVQTQVDAERPWTIARAFMRQATKELAVSKARSGLNLDGAAGTLFQFAASTAWTATEKADTRCWGLLPREVQVLRGELPIGEHQLQLAPVGADGFSVGPAQSHTVSIHDAVNSYLIVIAPGDRLHVVSGQAE